MGVKLEVFRMTLYLTFPVAMFWIANQATWFEDYVIERKRELWPPEKESQNKRVVLFLSKPSLRSHLLCGPKTSMPKRSCAGTSRWCGG
ncbi:protein PET100 homolog, mitochondrial isoform X3 [Tupaia chinensis]|uniref:protein PET100 homolog, mitochondrial isoform X3 n=1 Tax=Tupaia chinensis TaxID=246437 RepID=UPI000703C982|nr:protein PET100 homolog, mitochondrial isoform X3 [Tupaia chinensis]